MTSFFPNEPPHLGGAAPVYCYLGAPHRALSCSRYLEKSPPPSPTFPLPTPRSGSTPAVPLSGRPASTGVHYRCRGSSTRREDDGDDGDDKHRAARSKRRARTRETTTRRRPLAVVHGGARAKLGGRGGGSVARGWPEEGGRRAASRGASVAGSPRHGGFRDQGTWARCEERSFRKAGPGLKA